MAKNFQFIIYISLCLSRVFRQSCFADDTQNSTGIIDPALHTVLRTLYRLVLSQHHSYPLKLNDSFNNLFLFDHLIGKAVKLSASLNAQCLKVFGELEKGLDDRRGWALHLFHSTGKIPTSGLYEGNFYALGSFDRCLVLNNHLINVVPNLISISLGPAKLSSQYCVASIDISRFIFKQEQGYTERIVRSLKTQTPVAGSLPALYYHVGLCLPSQCSPRFIGSALQLLLRAGTARGLLQSILSLEQVQDMRQALLDSPLKIDSLTCTGQTYLNVPITVDAFDDDANDINSKELPGEQLTRQIDEQSALKKRDLYLGTGFFALFLAILVLASIRDYGYCLLKFNAPLDGRKRVYYQILSTIVGSFSVKKNLYRLIGGGETPNNSIGHHGHIENGTSSNGTSYLNGGCNSLKNGDIRIKIRKNEIVKATSSQKNTCVSNSELKNKICDKRKYTDIIYGLRGLSMLHVFYAHTYLFSSFVSSNLGEILGLRLMQDPWIVFLYSGFFAVDTFFFISGFLYVLTTHTAQRKLYRDEQLARWNDKHEKSAQINLRIWCHEIWSFTVRWVRTLAHRIARLLPVYLAVLIFEILVAPYIGTLSYGPAPFALISEPRSRHFCRRNWWTNLAFVNNLVNVRAMCGVWTWYLANDIQFNCLAAPIIMLIVYKLDYSYQNSTFIPDFWAKNGQRGRGENPLNRGQLAENTSRRGMKFLIGLIVVVVCLTFYTSYLNGYKPGILPDDPHLLDFFYDFYIKPYIRITPYLVGLTLGYYIQTQGSTTVEVQSHEPEQPSGSKFGGYKTMYHITSSLLYGNTTIVEPKSPTKEPGIWKDVAIWTIIFTSFPPLTLLAFPLSVRLLARYFWQDQTRWPTFIDALINAFARLVWASLLSLVLLLAHKFYKNSVGKGSDPSVTVHQMNPPTLVNDDDTKRGTEVKVSGPGKLLVIVQNGVKALGTGVATASFTFLSARIWVVLGNLAYATYLIHPSVIQIAYKSLRNPLYTSHLLYLVLFLGFLFLSLAFALFLHLTFELPFIHMKKELPPLFSALQVAQFEESTKDGAKTFFEIRDENHATANGSVPKSKKYE